MINGMEQTAHGLFCTPCKLRVVFTFLKDYDKEKKKICNRDGMWPAEPKMFIIWPFIESGLWGEVGMERTYGRALS